MPQCDERLDEGGVVDVAPGPAQEVPVKDQDSHARGMVVAGPDIGTAGMFRGS